ncbi:hypothetical protein HKX48_001449, partial [Thoreauomyces humboldtii]
MNVLPINDLDIAKFHQNDDGTWKLASSECTSRNLTNYQKHGAFKTLDSISDLANMKLIIEKNHDLKKDHSRAVYLSAIGTFLKKLGPARCGLTSDQHDTIVKRYNASSKNLETDYKANRHNAETFDWDSFASQIIADEKRAREVLYDLETPTSKQISAYADQLMLLMRVLVPDCRGNAATLKIHDHPNVDLGKDNYIIPTPNGHTVIVWNVRKADRIKKGKQPSVIDQDDWDKTRYTQSLHNLLSTPLLNAQLWGALASKFIIKFRKDSEYLFCNENGHPFMNLKDLENPKDKDNRPFDPFSTRIKKLSGKGLQIIRRSQITAVRDAGLTRVQAEEYCKDSHH